jgi:hypothetical protein
MKKNIFTIITLLTLFVSCKHASNDKPLTEEEVKPKDSTMVGVDKDENGCLASAGYTWSKLNKECIRAFTGIQLNPFDNAGSDDATLSAYVLFDETGDKAEVFMPDEKSIILTRKSEGSPWIFEDYQLIPWKGYVFKKADKILFTGDGEIGNKVTGSDDKPEGTED